MKHLLIIGRSGVGKTTLIKHLVQALRRRPIDGFVTEEYREETNRVGFWLSPLDGRQMLLAHRELSTGVRVGPYKVNTAVLDEVAVPLIHRAKNRARVLFLDELGKMGLASAFFARAVREAFDQGPSIVATASIAPVSFLDSLKERRDVELVPLTAANRESVTEELIERLPLLCAEEPPLRELEACAKRICELIVAGQVPLLDIEIQQAVLRELVAKAFPDKPHQYQLLYETRFRRLWQQFRHDT